MYVYMYMYACIYIYIYIYIYCMISQELLEVAQKQPEKGGHSIDRGNREGRPKHKDRNIRKPRRETEETEKGDRNREGRPKPRRGTIL